MQNKYSRSRYADGKRLDYPSFVGHRQHVRFQVLYGNDADRALVHA